MDRMPVLLTAWFCSMNVHTYLAFLGTYLYMASHAHCGFAHPWDPMQWLTCGNAYHDTHHRLTWTGYQASSLIFVFG
jgi:sterol desaturase/sphingolipid hydroxylase (fatty acid hydroxylase superfamily)